MRIQTIGLAGLLLLGACKSRIERLHEKTEMVSVFCLGFGAQPWQTLALQRTADTAFFSQRERRVRDSTHRTIVALDSTVDGRRVKFLSVAVTESQSENKNSCDVAMNALAEAINEP